MPTPLDPGAAPTAAAAGSPEPARPGDRPRFLPAAFAVALILAGLWALIEWRSAPPPPPPLPPAPVSR